MNKCMFMGRFTRDPELVYTKNGHAVVDFSIAVNEGKDENGNDRVIFPRLQAWNKLAEDIKKNFWKGKPIIVDAKLRQEEWTDPEGNPRKGEKYVVNFFNYVLSDNTQRPEGTETPGEAEAPKTKGRARKNATPKPAEDFPAEGGEDEEDIPF